MRKFTKGLFYVESPFQLLCAIEARYQFNLDKNYLFIRLNNSINNNEQIKKTLATDNAFDKVIFLNISKGLSYLNISKFYLVLLKHKFSNPDIFVGDIRPKVLSILRSCFDKTKIYIMDDGIASLSLYKKYKSYNFYSFLDLEDTKLVKNSFSHLHEKSDGEKIYNDKIVYFFGAPIVEKGGISNEYFIERIHEIIKYYQKLKIKFIYVMHREENVSKLDFIGKDNIIQFDIPIEVQFLRSSELPQNIASFYSAALITLTKMFPNIIATSFYIQNEQVNEPFKNNIENCYVYYKKLFKIV